MATVHVTPAEFIARETGVHPDIVETALAIMQEVHARYPGGMYKTRAQVEEVLKEWEPRMLKEDYRYPGMVRSFLFRYPRKSGVIHSDAPANITMKQVNAGIQEPAYSPTSSSFVYKEPKTSSSFVYKEPKIGGEQTSGGGMMKIVLPLAAGAAAVYFMMR